MLGGKGPFGTIDMGGMFTILKVRDHLTGDSAAAGTSTPPGRSPSRRPPTSCAATESTSAREA